jgi:hypothetical protein
MKKYHVTFIEKDQVISSGKMYLATTPFSALIAYTDEFPEATFLYIASEEMFNYKY